MGYAALKGQYSIKGLLINVALTVMFATPIVLTTKGLDSWEWLWKVNVVTLLVTLVTPPWGWKKPHPHTPAPLETRLRTRPTAERRRSDGLDLIERWPEGRTLCTRGRGMAAAQRRIALGTRTNPICGPSTRTGHTKKKRPRTRPEGISTRSTGWSHVAL